MKRAKEISLKISEYKLTPKSGYTLLEVMVALIIIGISITAVTGALSTSKGLSARADHAIESVRILNNILNNPELMKIVVANKNFEKVLEDEDGWIVRAQTDPLIINSADLAWDVDGRSLNKSNNTKKNKKQLKENSRKNIGGKEIEVPGMVSVILCIRQTNQLIEKEYCVSSWKRQQNSVNKQILTKRVEKERDN